MKLNSAVSYLGAPIALLIGGGVPVVDAQGGQMVKMCLFYEQPSGHARSDPIINQQCASGHVHTFYGPLEFHPDTTYEDLINVIKTPELSTSPVVENQSLYWHPSIYQVENNGDGTETFTRVSKLDSSPYYRWDKSALPLVEAFSPGFRMIAASNDPGANQDGETGSNMFTECCNIDRSGEEDCVSWDTLNFPARSCDFVGIAFNMPTCWNGELGDTNDHKDHMAFTVDGTVTGECPATHNRRLPQVQLFVRIPNYRGDLYKYQLSDGTDDVWHVDFFNGWQEGKLQEIIDECEYNPDQEVGELHPPCDCTGDAREEVKQVFLTSTENVADTVCDTDVRRLIVNEVIDVTDFLPTGTCEGSPLIPKSWDGLTVDLYTCEEEPSPPTNPPPNNSPPAPAPVPPAPPTIEEEEPTDLRWVVCGRGVGDRLKACPEGDMQLVNAEDEDEVHEVRCCRDERKRRWKTKCEDVFAKSKVRGGCHEVSFYDAIDICENAGGRLCTKDEVISSCAKGTGCGHDRELIWTCTEEDGRCDENAECCTGLCDGDGFCLGIF